MRHVFVLLLAGLLVLQACGPSEEVAEAPDSQQPPLIDREIFFDDPEYAGAQISPNGDYISFRKQLDGVMNVWVKERGDELDEAWPVTSDTTRPITSYFWSHDSENILYLQDEGGDENFDVFAVDPTAEPPEDARTPEARNLTPMDDVRAMIYSVPRATPDHIVIGLNDRDPQYHDAYRLNIETGETELLVRNEHNVAGWHTDRDGEVRLATRQTADGGTELLKVHDQDSLEAFYSVTFEEQVGASRFHEDGSRFYMITNKGDDADLSRFVLYDLETDDMEVISQDPEGEVDFGGAIFSNKTDEILAFRYFGDYPRIYPQDDEFASDLEYIENELGDIEIRIASRTHEEDIWLISTGKDTDPGSVYVYDRENRELDLLYRSRPELNPDHLAEMRAIRYTARDGLEIPAYLTIPQGIDEEEQLPVVVNPHGGPWARDYWGYNPTAQFLANRGYAVLQINFRGSSGFGKEFLNAGNKEWGTGYMQHDITDGVQYLIEEGIADPDRIGIYGGSYGGYATLAGLAYTPELYAAGVSFVGPSNIITLLNSIPPYWEPMIKMFHNRVGNPDDPEERERLKEQSPLFSAENITAPLLVIQGANDPRVDKAESDQIVAAMRDLNREVEYIVAPDEGHGFRRRVNRLAYIYAMEQFFADHLGGRYQEDLADEYRNRLDEITVDIAEVEMPEEEPAAEAAAELPLPDISRFKAGTKEYKTTVDAQGRQIEMDVVQELAETEFEGEPAWRFIETAESSAGQVIDTLWLDYDTMLPKKRAMQQGPQISVNIRFYEDRLEGEIAQGPQQFPVEAELEDPVFADGSIVQQIIASLPLEVGYTTSYRIFDVMQQETKEMQVEVTGIEDVDVPAGSFEAFHIVANEIGGDDSMEMWVSTEDRLLVKSESQLPAQAGGGSFTSELASY